MTSVGVVPTATGSAHLSIPRARAWRLRWERQQEQYVIDRDLRFDVMIRWLRAVVGDRPRCLDLGCGTGALTERLVDRLPGARVVAVDFDPVTRRLGEVGLGRRGGRVTWVDADLRDPRWPRSIPVGQYDAALSSTALHWLRGPELARLYRGLARRLRRGGMFLDSDRLSFAPDARRLRSAERGLGSVGRTRKTGASARAAESWDEWWARVAREPALAEEVRLHRERFPRGHTDTPTPDLAGHVRRLRRAGFAEVELVWARGASRVLAAVR